MSEHFEVLSAVLDGETVDIGELEMTLEQPVARRAFIDFVRLRHATASDIATPRPEFHERALEELAVTQRMTARGLPFPVAAAAILVALLVGSLVNFDLQPQNRAPAPPEPARVLRFEPGVDWQR
jgi:hypothetical protein